MRLATHRLFTFYGARIHENWHHFGRATFGLRTTRPQNLDFGRALYQMSTLAPTLPIKPLWVSSAETIGKI